MSDHLEMATPEDVEELEIPEELKKRYLKLIKYGLTKGELVSLLEQNEFMPVVISYDLKANPELSIESVEKLIQEFRDDVRTDMRARELGLLFLKGLGLAAKVAARGGSPL